VRVVGGTLSGRTLKAPPGRDTRPTSDRVREALFNLLASRTSFGGAAVLDLFAGSGALAVEALSRGAASATLVERHGPTLAVAKANAEALGLASAVRPVRADALAFLRRPPAQAFDVAFADPPYALPAIPDLPALVRPHLAPGALFALEHDTRHDFADAPGLVLTRAYGQTVVSLFDA
jgi:16S rRNA (guanine966-N2)-methyltransferase